MTTIKKYANFISEQQRQLKILGLSSTGNLVCNTSLGQKNLQEQEDPAVTKKVMQKDQDAFHIHTKGTEHIYGGEDSDRETHTYHVHNTATGKTHSFQLEHGGGVVSRSQIRKMAPKEVSDKAVAAIHKDHKEEMAAGGIDEGA